MHQIATLTIALVLSAVLTPIFRVLAIRWGLVDHPDPTRKLHKHAIAISGGVAVFLACFLACGCSLIFFKSLQESFLRHSMPTIGLTICAAAIVLLGAIDDRWALRGRQKLAGQILIALMLIGFGFQMRSVSFFGWDVNLGLLAIPVSLGWLLLTINALNLIDGADGLCSTVGWIASAGIAAMASLGSHSVEAMIAAGLAGSLLGFLIYNFPPARIFLGDAGSMLIGLLLGALALKTSLKEATAVSLLLPITILAIPLFDSSMAILRRKLTGRSIFTVDRGHLHHNLLRRGYTNRGLVVVVTLLCGFVAAGAFFGMYFDNDAIAISSLVLAIGGLIVTRLFGFAELTMLANKLVHFGASMLARNGKSDNYVRQQMVRLQGCRSWDRIWKAMTHFAETHDLARVCMDLNVPWLHEGFHASWQRNKLPEAAARWTTKLPVLVNGRLLGRLEVIGKLNCDRYFETLSALAVLLESLQPELARLASETPILLETPNLVTEPVAKAVSDSPIVTL